MWDPDNAACEDYDCSRAVSNSSESESPCRNYHHSCLDKKSLSQNQNLSPMKHEADLSLYSNSSPSRPICGSPDGCSHQRRRPLEDHDQNSQDSGYGAGCPGEGSRFHLFARSLGVTPRQDCSPTKNVSLSFGSMDSMDDEFLEFTDLEQPINENSQLPTDFNALISGPFNTNTSPRDISPMFDFTHRPPFRRAISYASGQTPNSSRVRSCLFKKNDCDFRSFKRPERPEEPKSPIQNKRSRVEQMCVVPGSDQVVVPQRPIFGRSISASEESIKFAVHRSFTEPDLIGDFSRSFCLPLTSGRHQDLKSITPATLATLMRGGFKDAVNTFKVIDCRYPYEYNGGHIEGATNFYTKEQILEHLLDTKVTQDEENLEKPSRNILVFHCEFSSERGPNLYRFLRKWDRFRNTDVYPALHYPEIYLLEGGYKSFFEQYSELCVPEAYLPMLNPEHSKDLKHFRAKSKTWNDDRYKRSLKRLQ